MKTLRSRGPNRRTNPIRRETGERSRGNPLPSLRGVESVTSKSWCRGTETVRMSCVIKCISYPLWYDWATWIFYSRGCFWPNFLVCQQWYLQALYEKLRSSYIRPTKAFYVQLWCFEEGSSLDLRTMELVLGLVRYYRCNALQGNLTGISNGASPLIGRYFN